MKPATAGQMAAFFFSFAGRTSRREYILGMAFIILLQAAILDFALRRSGNAYVSSLPDGAIVDDTAAAELLFSAIGQVWLLLLILLVTTVAISARRFQDLGLPGVLSVVMLFPFVNVLSMIALAVIPGTPGANRHGPPPRYT